MSAGDRVPARGKSTARSFSIWAAASNGTGFRRVGKSASHISPHQVRCSPLNEPIKLNGVSLTRQELAERAASLGAQGVYVGTSSWKYPGWCGMLYDRARYEYRGRFADLFGTGFMLFELLFQRSCILRFRR